jgi:hypothetical protein
MNYHPGQWSDYTKRSHEQLVLDLNAAWDRIKALLHENNELAKRVIDLTNELETERKWRRWQNAAFVATWGAIIGLFKFLVPYLVKGILQK